MLVHGDSCADAGATTVVAVIEGTDRVVELVPRNINLVGAVLDNRFSPSRVLMRQPIPLQILKPAV